MSYTKLIVIFRLINKKCKHEIMLPCRSNCDISCKNNLITSRSHAKGLRDTERD